MKKPPNQARQSHLRQAPVSRTGLSRGQLEQHEDRDVRRGNEAPAYGKARHVRHHCVLKGRVLVAAETFVSILFFLPAARFCADERCFCDDTFDDATVSPSLSLSALLFLRAPLWIAIPVPKGAFLVCHQQPYRRRCTQGMLALMILLVSPHMTSWSSTVLSCVTQAVPGGFRWDRKDVRPSFVRCDALE